VTALPDALSHVLWLGGAPRVGKSTLARLLAGRYDLKIYNLDWHQVREHQGRLDPARHPVSVAWREASTHDRWVTPTAADLVERGIATWTEGFELVVEDLAALPRSRVVVADGPGALPWCVAPVVRSPRQALFLVPMPELRDAVLARRLRDVPEDSWMGADTGDPVRARRNLRDRDVLLGERIVAACAELGLRCEVWDGSLDLDDSLALLEEHFRPHLPETVNV